MVVQMAVWKIQLFLLLFHFEITAVLVTMFQYQNYHSKHVSNRGGAAAEATIVVAEPMNIFMLIVSSIWKTSLIPIFAKVAKR